MDSRTKSIRYLQRQLSDGAATLKSKAVDPYTRKPYRTRNAWILLQMRVKNFLEDKTGAKRIVIMPGLRGVGKTTLISQLYLWLERYPQAINQLYIQLDEAVEKVGVNLSDLLDAYEELLGVRYEALHQPTIIYIDEIQSDSSWPRIVKFINDRAPHVFFVCTGSSAVQLQLISDADLTGRRGYLDKLYPLSFVEEQVLRGKELPLTGLKEKISTALYHSFNAQEVYDRLKILEPIVNREWIKYDRSGIRQFLQKGTLPHLIFDPDPASQTQFVSSMVDKIIESDIQALGNFKSDTIPQMKRTISILAENDSIAIEKLMRAVGISSKTTIYSILDAFIQAELLIKVPAYGGNLEAVRDPARYMFMSPAIRYALFSVVGIVATDNTRQGLLLQDYAALTYYRQFVKNGKGRLSHPYNKEGGTADFILAVDNTRQIAIEVSLANKNSYQQAKETAASRKCTYGLIFHSGELAINGDKTVVKVPLDYFFLS